MKAVHLAIELGLRITPEHLHAAFPEPGAFVLGGGGNPRLDRTTYLGAEPALTFRARRLPSSDAEGRALADVVVTEGGSAWRRHAVDPFESLRELLRTHAVPQDVVDPRYPFPFHAGLVGYFGYECGQLLERLPRIPRPGVGLPDIALSLHRWVVATERAQDTSWLSVVGFGPNEAAARADAEATRARVEARLRATVATVPTASPRPAQRIVPGLAAAAYLERIATAKRHIDAGDAYEICLTNAYRTPYARDLAWPLFLELARENPAPFAALLDLPEGAIVSSSPERFLSLDASRTAESRPIKGTRPRASAPDDDARLARELATSEKDRAENAMIVDLVRNDLGRVCRYGSVEVPELYAVEPYATVFQLVSTIRGRLSDDKDAVDLLRACFPPGSMTGAPKIEAMSILERLEPTERGVYSGGLGWLDLGGAMDLSVVIRTIVLAGDTATFSVGGAIVADSDAHAELEETGLKARALVHALARFTSTDDPVTELRP